jgi:hypothetical protein
MGRPRDSRPLRTRVLHAATFAIPGAMFAIQRAVRGEPIEAVAFGALGLGISLAVFFFRFS